MPTISALNEDRASRASIDTLREVTETLAPMSRRAGTDGEREAAEWRAARLERAGAPARVEEEEFLDGWPDLHRLLSTAGAASGVLALTGRARAAAVAGGLASAGLIADDVSNGARPARRVLGARKTTWNVVAELGEPDAERTFVVIAHHDAAHGGRAFDQTMQRRLSDWFPG